MKKIITLTLILFSCFSYSRAQLPPAYEARLQFVLDSVCTKLNIKGVSAAVLVPNVGIWKGVYGESTTGTPISSSMLLGMGSNTKTHVASLMLKLQEMGMVSITDTIGKWIQGYPNINGQITIHQILNHTSGIYDYAGSQDFNDSLLNDFSRVWQPEELLQFIKTPYFAPGTNWQYSNGNYLIAGLIIKKILGQPINVSMRNYILAPQGLNHTFFCPQDTTTDTMAHSWTINFGVPYLVDMQSIPGYSNNALFSMAATAGGLVTTAEDNVNFWHKLISGQIINATSLSQMLNAVYIGYSSPIAGHSIYYGLGIFRYQNYMNGHTIYTHGGTNVGFINENMVDSITGVAISVLTNQDSLSNSIVATNIVKALHKVTLSPVSIAVINEIVPGVAVYPNPASDYISMKLDHVALPAHVMITDVVGKTMVSKDINSNQATIPTGNIPTGIYLLQVEPAQCNTPLLQKIQIAH